MKSILKKISVFTMFLFMSILFLAPANVKAATVGDQLYTPENGWRRYDDSELYIKYIGSGWERVSSSTLDYSNNTAIRNKIVPYPSGDKILFKFYGTKIRILGVKYSTTQFPTTQNAICNIDGIEYNYSNYSTTRIPQCILSEITGLKQGVHTVQLYSGDSNLINFDSIDIDDTGYLIDYYRPTNLVATPGNEKVTLKWDIVTEATGYVIHYGKDSGNLSETKTVTGSTITTSIIDGLLNGTKYYFTVSAIINGSENTPSAEVFATPNDNSVPSDHLGNNATLELTMTNGGIKIYNLPITDLDDFLTWYDNRSDGNGKAYYTFTKTTNIAPYLSIKEYISFDKISSFEVKEYNQ